MNTITVELHRLAAEAHQYAAHVHLPMGAFRMAITAVLAELRRLVTAAGGPKAVLREAVRILGEALEGGAKCWPTILREVLELVGRAIEKAHKRASKNDQTGG